MRRRLRTRRFAASAAAALLVLAGCAGTPAPDWASNAHASLERFETAWLRGDSRAAQSEFDRARSELSRTGRPDLVAHAELVRCALQVASLDFGDCPGFAPLAQDAGAAASAYADYLGGRWATVQPGLLPAQHRGILTAGTEAQAAAALASMEAPASRLVAAGALLRAGRIGPSGIAAAVETASAQGWRRPLLAWLGVQEQRARASGDAEAAAAIRRRMRLVTTPAAR